MRPIRRDGVVRGDLGNAQRELQQVYAALDTAALCSLMDRVISVDTRVAHLVPPSLNPGDEAAPGTPGTGEGVCPHGGGTGRMGAGPCPERGGSGHVTMGIGGA